MSSLKAMFKRIKKKRNKTGRSLYRFRMKHGWSKRRMATELGVSIPSIMRWEAGKCAPDDYNMFNIRKLLASRVTTDE